jgi:general secretion pathway protein D
MGALAKFVQNDNNANILSTPNLLTLDNEEAKIVVGQNVPFITGSYAQTGSTTTASPFQTIERKDVGLTLRIKPQILEGGTVKLQIFQEVSSVNNLTNTAGIITNTRSLESTVLVEEGRIVVLGGLIQDSVSMKEDKVPVLGDIPWLGNLFRHEIRQQTKTNLMIFIRPYVLRTASAPNSFTQDRYDYLSSAQKESQLQSRTVLPDMTAPSLPPINQKPESPLHLKTEQDLKPSTPNSGSGPGNSSAPSH